jgi:hypothetical protein
MQIGEIQTKSSVNANTYPKFISNYSGGLLDIPSVPAGYTYILENPNASYFPFYSPSSTPYIDYWLRYSSASTYGNFSSTTLNNVLATNQVFNFIKFQVGTAGNAGGGNLYRDASDGPQIIDDGNGWIAEIFHDENSDETIILIYNN